jgi:hypothetical protein
MCRPRLTGHRVIGLRPRLPKGGMVPECLPRCLGAQHADRDQTGEQSPFHPLYLRGPGTFPLLMAPNHGITGGAQGDP